MADNTLNIVMRTELKKRPCAKLRQEGMIPAVVYGGKEQLCIAVEDREFERKFHKASENIVITLLQDGKELCDVIIKDYQDDILSGKIQHIDFLELAKDKIIKARVPLCLDGAPAGVKAGGKLVQTVKIVEIECLPKDLPEKIFINIDSLGLGQAAKAGEIPAVEGIKFLIDPESIIAHVAYPKGMKAAQ